MPPAPKIQILSNTNTDAEEQKTEGTSIRRRRHSLAARLIMRRAYTAPGSSMQYQENVQESVAGLEEVDFFYDNFHLPESTFTFLITEPILSAPFAVGLVAYVVSLMCLALALQNEFDNGSDDNKFAIAEVTTTVRIVQLLMDDEIPTGLELIGKTLEQKEEGDILFERHFAFIYRYHVSSMSLHDSCPGRQRPRYLF